MFLVGHRGIPLYELENSKASMDRAILFGIDAYETDFHALNVVELGGSDWDHKITSDEELAIYGSALGVMHDRRVDRTTNGSGYIRDHTPKQFGGLELKNGEGRPMYSHEVIKYWAGRCEELWLDLKSLESAKRIAPVLNYFIEYKGIPPERFKVQSYFFPELRKFKERVPNVDIMTLMVGDPENHIQTAKKLGAIAANISIEVLSRRYVDEAHAEGLLMHVWGADLPADYEELADLGVISPRTVV
jgi:glycerophosphoryl diester phosphodiesterase